MLCVMGNSWAGESQFRNIRCHEKVKPLVAAALYVALPEAGNRAIAAAASLVVVASEEIAYNGFHKEIHLISIEYF